MVFNVGTVCVKIAGRDAGKTCVIIEMAKDGFVTIDGETRRRKCNVRHLEPLNQTVKVAVGASHLDVMKALGLEPRKVQSRKPTVRPQKHTTKIKVATAKKAAKPVKKAVKSKKA